MQPLSTRGSKLKFSTCVDSIRDNLKRIRNGSKRDNLVQKCSLHPREDDNISSLKIVANRKRKDGHRKKSSFEVYLSTIPKLDPVDRTVGWVMRQPEHTVVSNINQLIINQNIL